MYNEIETIVNTMRDFGSRTSHEGKEAYERAVNLKTKSTALLKTKKSLIDKGIIDLYCANKISEQESSRAAIMAEMMGGKIAPSDL
jgi:hypothetical protein